MNLIRSLIKNTSKIISNFLVILILLIEGCSTTCTELHTDNAEYYFTPIPDLLPITDTLIYNYMRSDWLKDEVNLSTINSFIKQHIYNMTIAAANAPEQAEKNRNTRYEYYIAQWRKIENRISESYKIYYYYTPEEDWENFSVQEGMAVIKECNVLYVLVFNNLIPPKRWNDSIR